MQTNVEAALSRLLDQVESIIADLITELVGRAVTPAIPELASPAIALHADGLLPTEMAALPRSPPTPR